METRQQNPLLGIVADDLTGSMDVAGQFVQHGLTTTVVVNPLKSPIASTNQIICFNTQSRLTSPQEAAEVVTRATSNLQKLGVRQFFKKIDSTMRGNVGSEITAMMGQTNAKMALICPAFPSMGRTVKDGVLLVNRRPLSEASEGDDPFNKVGSSSVTRALHQQTNQSVALLTHQELEGGRSSVKMKIDKFLREGTSLIVFDSVTHQHFHALLDVVDKYFPDCLLVGSAGLAGELANRLSHLTAEPPEKYESTVAPKPSLLISGSLNDTSNRQLEQLRTTTEIQFAEMNGAGILSGTTDLAREYSRILGLVESNYSENSDVAICWSQPEAVRNLLATAKSDEIDCLIELIRRISHSIGESYDFSALILIGGETAYTVLDSLDVTSIDLLSEVETGIPFGQIIGGPLSERFLITKAGGFGDDNSLVNVVSFLRELRTS